jgi:GT2 family glycosyltransferase
MTALRASVVIAVRQGATVMPDLIESLRALRFSAADFEIIVVDNGSTDDTARIVRSLGDDIRVMHEPVRGSAAARNCGILAARGWAVAFTDADAVVEPDWLAELVAPLEDQTIGVVGGRILSVQPCNRIERFGERIHDQERAISQVEPYASSGNWASRRNVLLETGLFDVSLLRGQDVDLAWRIRAAGYRLVYAPNAIVRHRNEKTLLGLMREGYVHGLHGAQLRQKYGKPPDRKGRRLAGALRRMTRDKDLVNGALGVVFDAGKVTGQLVAELRALSAHESKREGS